MSIDCIPLCRAELPEPERGGPRPRDHRDTPRLPGQHGGIQDGRKSRNLYAVPNEQTKPVATVI